MYNKVDIPFYYRNNIFTIQGDGFMKKAKKILGIIGNIILWAFVLFAVLITLLVFSSNKDQNGMSSLFGRAPISILTNSMKSDKGFSKGDLILCKVLTDEEKNSCEVGDVITFYTDLNGDGKEEFNSHRIVAVTKEGGTVHYTTRGDNNPGNDSEEVYAPRIVAKWTGVRIPVLGRFLEFLKTKTGFFVCILLPLILFFLYELVQFIITLVTIKAEKEAEKAKKEEAGSSLSKEEEEEIKRRAVEEYLKQQAAAQPAEPKDPAAQHPES